MTTMASVSASVVPTSSIALSMLRGVVGHRGFELLGEVLLDGLEFFASGGDHVECVGVGKRPDADEHRRLARKRYGFVVALGTQRNGGHIAQSNDRTVLFADDQVLELFDAGQVGVRREVDPNVRATRRAQRRKVVVRRQCLSDLSRSHATRGHAFAVEPHSHREGASAQDVGALHTWDRTKSRLNDANQVVRDFVLAKKLGREAQVRRCKLTVRGFDVDDRNFGFGRQVAANLVDFGTDLRKRSVGVVVEFQSRPDDRDVLTTFGLDVVDAIRCGDCAFDRRRDEAANQIRVGTHVRRGDRDGGVFVVGILTNSQRGDRLETGDHDDDVHHNRDDRPFDEEVRELHGSAVFGCGWRPVRSEPRLLRWSRRHRFAA